MNKGCRFLRPALDEHFNCEKYFYINSYLNKGKRMVGK